MVLDAMDAGETGSQQPRIEVMAHVLKEAGAPDYFPPEALAWTSLDKFREYIANEVKSRAQSNFENDQREYEQVKREIEQANGEIQPGDIVGAMEAMAKLGKLSEQENLLVKNIKTNIALAENAELAAVGFIKKVQGDKTDEQMIAAIKAAIRYRVENTSNVQVNTGKFDEDYKVHSRYLLDRDTRLQRPYQFCEEHGLKNMKMSTVHKILTNEGHNPLEYILVRPDEYDDPRYYVKTEKASELADIFRTHYSKKPEVEAQEGDTQEVEAEEEDAQEVKPIRYGGMIPTFEKVVAAGGFNRLRSRSLEEHEERSITNTLAAIIPRSIEAIFKKLGEEKMNSKVGDFVNVIRYFIDQENQQNKEHGQTRINMENVKEVFTILLEHKLVDPNDTLKTSMHIITLLRSRKETSAIKLANIRWVDRFSNDEIASMAHFLRTRQGVGLNDNIIKKINDECVNLPELDNAEKRHAVNRDLRVRASKFADYILENDQGFVDKLMQGIERDEELDGARKEILTKFIQHVNTTVRDMEKNYKDNDYGIWRQSLLPDNEQ